MPAAANLICTSSATGSPMSISSTVKGELSSHKRAPLVFMGRHHRTCSKSCASNPNNLRQHSPDHITRDDWPLDPRHPLQRPRQPEPAKKLRIPKRHHVSHTRTREVDD